MDWLELRGGSMHPLLREGDEIGVEWGPYPAPLLEGDVVVFRGADGEWVAHRVVGALGPGKRAFLTKGDASICCERIALGEIWGRVVAFRSACGGRASSLERHWLDRLIAEISRRSAGTERLLMKRVELRLARALGAARRAMAARLDCDPARADAGEGQPGG